MSYVEEMVSHEGGCQWQIGKRTKHWGQNVSQIISQKHFTTKESTSVHNHITQLILVALTIIIRGFFFLFFLFFFAKKNVKLATKTIKTQAKKEERKK